MCLPSEDEKGRARGWPGTGSDSEGGWLSEHAWAGSGCVLSRGSPRLCHEDPRGSQRIPNPALGIFQLDLFLGLCSAGQQFLAHLYSEDDLRLFLI